MGLKRKKPNSNVPTAWLSEYHWLDVYGDLMVCTLCKRASAAGVWSEGVQYQERFKKTRLDEHCLAAKHVEALKRQADISNALKFFSAKPHLADDKIRHKYRQLFRNVFFVARNDLALNLIEKMHAHVSLMGVQLPINHLSRTTGSEILAVIGEYFRDAIIQDLKDCKYFSIMLDETTDNTTTKQLIIFVKYCKDSVITTRFLTILPLKIFTGVGIYSVVSSYFKAREIFHKVLFICTDGAPVMLSTNEGLAGHIIKENPYALSFHCIAHRFSLGVNATVSDSKYLSRVCSFVSDAYAYLYASPKRVLALFENQRSIEEYTLNLLKPLKIRWLSFLRAAARICEIYKSVYETFKQLSKDDAHAKGLKKVMEKMHILLWIHALADILPTLNFVLSNLEKEDVDASTLETCINGAVETLTANFLRGSIATTKYKRISSSITANELIYGTIPLALPKKNTSVQRNLATFCERYEFKVDVSQREFGSCSSPPISGSHQDSNRGRQQYGLWRRSRSPTD